MIVVLEDYW